MPNSNVDGLSDAIYHNKGGLQRDHLVIIQSHTPYSGTNSAQDRRRRMKSSDRNPGSALGAVRALAFVLHAACASGELRTQQKNLS